MADGNGEVTGPRIGFCDIETSPNVADVWGLWQQNVALSQLRESTRLMSFAWKWKGDRRVRFYSEYNFSTEQIDPAKRAEMIEAGHQLFDEADILVTFNGDSFDIPHMRREFAQAELTPPSPFRTVDLCSAVKRTFRFPSNKLDYVSQALGLRGKVAHSGHDLWVQCLAGDAKAWRKFRTYNKRDTVLNEELYDRILPWLPRHPHVALYDADTEEDNCPRCSSTDLERRGYARTELSTFIQYRCRGCGSWCRGKKSVDVANLRGVAR